jgi:hypothetical protein
MPLAYFRCFLIAIAEREGRERKEEMKRKSEREEKEIDGTKKERVGLFAEKQAAMTDLAVRQLKDHQMSLDIMDP